MFLDRPALLHHARSAFTIALLTGPSALACSPAAPAGPAGPAPVHFDSHVSSNMPLERLFPLADGYVYQYATSSDSGDVGQLVAYVRRLDASHGELRFPSGARSFEYVPDGVMLSPSGSYVLKLPLEVGNSWRGEHGGRTRIAEVGASVDVPAGHFQGCVTTIEERFGDRPVRYTTTFCPGVGIVVLDAASGADADKAELTSYAPPVYIGPDGTDSTRVPVP